MPGTRKLGKTTAQRKAMLRQQVTDFLATGRMETTVTRCKEIAPLAEKMISLGKAKDLAAYRQALSFITREDVAKKVFDEIAVVAAVGRRMAFRPGISGQVFAALGQAGINIRMITQSPDELNIIFGVNNEDFASAIRVLYDSFAK